MTETEFEKEALAWLQELAEVQTVEQLLAIIRKAAGRMLEIHAAEKKR